MKKYEIKCGKCYINILADDLKWSGNGLELYREGKIIAMFISWEYWIEGEVNETKPV